MSFIPGGTSRLYLEEISEPDHFRCTQENPQHECSCHCHVADTDNNGVCYTCGGYIASRDAGRYI